MSEKPNLRNINTGVVGCGFIERIHVEALRRLGNGSGTWEEVRL